MEIAIVSKTSLRIKGKNAILVVDPSEKSESNAALLLSRTQDSIKVEESTVVISGPGEYEAGGVKITGISTDNDLVYSMTVDSISLTLGKIGALEKLQGKLKESNILIVACDSITDASFLTSISTNAIIFYGEKAGEIGKAVGSEGIKKLPKYATTIDKLPAEVETIILE